MLPLGKMLVVDDHALVRNGLIQLLRSRCRFEEYFEASSAAEALETVRREKIDFAIVDLTLKPNQIDGLDLVRQLSENYRGIKILVVSMHDEMLYAARAVRAGAHGYLMKERPVMEIIDALAVIAAGKRYLSEAVRRSMHEAESEETGASPSRLAVLSKRELEVLAHIGEGLPPRTIALKLNLSVKTVEAHRQNIKAKLKLDTAVDLMQFAIAHRSAG